DHGDEYAEQLRSDGIAGGVNAEQRDGIDFRDAHRGRNLNGNAERDQQRRNRQCHSNADHQSGASGNQQCHDCERDSRKRLLVSDHGDEYAEQLRSDGIAGGVNAEQRDGIDFRDAHRGRNLNGNAERDQQRRNRQCHSNADHQSGAARDQQRGDCERDSRKRLLVSDHGDEYAEQLRSDGIAGGVNAEQRDGIDFRDAHRGRNLNGNAERDQQRRNRQCHSNADHQSGAARDQQRGDCERDSRKRLLVSDHGDEYAEQLRSDGIAGGVNAEQRDGIDFRDAHRGRNLNGNAERDQQRRNRQCHSNADHQSGAARDQQRGDCERDSRKRLLVSDHGDEYAEQLRSDGIAGGVNAEQRDGIDFRDAHRGRNLNGNAERDQQRRNRQCHSNADHQSGAARDQQRGDCERDSRKRLLVSDHGDEYAEQLRSDGIAGGVNAEQRDGIDFRDAHRGRNLNGIAERDQQRRNRQCHSNADHQSGAARDQQRGDCERDSRKRLLVSDHGDEYAEQLRSDGIAGGVNAEQRDGIDFRDAHGGRNLNGNAERDQQRRNRQCHSDADHQSGASGNQQRHDCERDSRKRLLVSDHGDEYAEQLRSDGIAGGVNAEQRDRIDFRDAHGGRNLNGNAERDQQRRNRQCHSDADHQSGASGNQQRHDCERDSRKRLLVSDHGDEYAEQLRSDGIAGGVNAEQRDRIDFRDAHGGRNLNG